MLQFESRKSPAPDSPDQEPRPKRHRSSIAKHEYYYDEYRTRTYTCLSNDIHYITLQGHGDAVGGLHPCDADRDHFPADALSGLRLGLGIFLLYGDVQGQLILGEVKKVQVGAYLHGCTHFFFVNGPCRYSRLRREATLLARASPAHFLPTVIRGDHPGYKW